jgi:hypothetical protein
MTVTTASLRERFHEPARDPPEPWEELCGSESALRVARGLASYPYVPLHWDEVPAGAAQALASACGAWRLDQLFVVPSVVRRLVGAHDGWVVAPEQVLALADQGTALWVNGDAPRVVAAVGLDELVGLDHVQIGTYARLTLVAPARRLTIRYNAVARHALDGQLAALRVTVAGCPLPVPHEPKPDLPHPWAHLVLSTAVSLRSGGPVVVRIWGLSARGARRTALIALTPHELVVAREPDPELLGDEAPSAHDVLAVPRRRMEGAESTDIGARLRTGGAEVDLVLPRALAHELCRLAEHCTGVNRAAAADGL